MNLLDAISIIKNNANNPAQGLPQEVFLMISSMTPLVNVDLLIKDEKGRTLLAWRDDLHCSTGWHIPGGIIRYRETLETRLQKVAQSELGINKIDFHPKHISVNELIHHEREERCHFISFLYECYLPSTFEPKNSSSKLYPGFLKWHDNSPSDLIKYHDLYVDDINNPRLHKNES
jgi:colanic acid biosynthesis protein WcaH